MSRWHVAIAEDQAITRHGLRLLVEAVPGVEVVGDVATGSDLLALCDRHSPNLVLTDLELPDVNGFALIRQVKRLRPDVAVVVLSVREDDESVVAALAAGASGYLAKSSDLDQIETAIRTLEHDPVYVDPVVAGRVVRALVDRSRSAGGGRPAGATDGQDTGAGGSDVGAVTGRERQVLELLGQGFSARNIGSQLGISERTVTKHLEHIYRKVGVHNRVGALRVAMRLGLVESTWSPQLSPRRRPEDACAARG